MDGDTLRVVLLALIGAGSAAWIGASLLVRVSGTWVREISAEERNKGERTETLCLRALGPFVSGHSEVAGGRQEYTGLVIGRGVHLKRRDHGVSYLRNQGYPPAIAEKRDGEEAARLKLRIAGEQMVGSFFPVKVEYTHQPPRVTQVLPMAPIARRYSRVASVGESNAASVELIDTEGVKS